MSVKSSRISSQVPQSVQTVTILPFTVCHVARVGSHVHVCARAHTYTDNIHVHGQYTRTRTIYTYTDNIHLHGQYTPTRTIYTYTDNIHVHGQYTRTRTIYTCVYALHAERHSPCHAVLSVVSLDDSVH